MRSLAAPATGRPSTTRLAPGLALVLLLFAHAVAASEDKSAPLVIGETFTIVSDVLSETRRINVYLPQGYADAGTVRFPVLYMPDGGMAEDFLHVAGLLQVSLGNGTMRPFVLVGIENTERRRDLTGPTKNEGDRKIAPRVGGSAAFRQFLAKELMPAIDARYRTTPESAIVGESLAGLFVVETFLLAPELFDTYIAIDPSLWWNDEELVKSAAARLSAEDRPATSLYLASSGEEGIATLVARLAAVAKRAPSVQSHHAPMPEEKHATIYHPAALKAFRTVFAPRVAAP